MSKRFKASPRMGVVVTLSILLLQVQGTAAALPSAPQFGIRGMKGLWWDGIEKYQKALPWAADHDLNFLMLCYSSFPASGRDWRAAYSAAEMKEFTKLAEESQ